MTVVALQRRVSSLERSMALAFFARRSGPRFVSLFGGWIQLHSFVIRSVFTFAGGSAAVFARGPVSLSGVASPRQTVLIGTITRLGWIRLGNSCGSVFLCFEGTLGSFWKSIQKKCRFDLQKYFAMTRVIYIKIGDHFWSHMLDGEGNCRDGTEQFC